MTTEDVQEILHLTHKISKLMRPKNTFGDVTRAEFFIMNVLSDAKHEDDSENFKGVTVTNISNIIHTSTAATSKLLRVVEDKGYITRVLDDNDRRVVYICLTEKGEHLTKNSRELAAVKIHKLVGKLGEEDTAALRRILKKIINITQEEE